MDAGAIGQLRKVQIFFNTGQDKIAGPVDRTVAAGAGIRKADYHLICGAYFLMSRRLMEMARLSELRGR